MTRPCIFFLFLTLAVIPALQGCDSTTPCVQPQDNPAQKLASLKREKDDTLYEMQLRQGELDEMMENAKHGVGVSDEWLQRKNQLTEQITQLQVKAHDLDSQIAASQNGN